MAPIIVVHVGLPKTGTTSFQEFLDYAIPDDWYYPKAGRERSDHSVLAKSILSQANNSNHLPSCVLTDSIQALVEDITSAGNCHSVIIISSEYFSEIEPDVFDSLFIAPLLQGLRADREQLVIVAGFKPIREFWVSCYCEYMLSPSTNCPSFGEYISEWRNSPLLNILDFIHSWSSVFGQSFNVAELVHGCIPMPIAAMLPSNLNLALIPHSRISNGLPFTDIVRNLKQGISAHSRFTENTSIPWLIDFSLPFIKSIYGNTSIYISERYLELLNAASSEFAELINSDDSCLISAAFSSYLLAPSRKVVLNQEVYDSLVFSMSGALALEGLLHTQHASTLVSQ